MRWLISALLVLGSVGCASNDPGGPQPADAAAGPEGDAGPSFSAYDAVIPDGSGSDGPPVAPHPADALPPPASALEQACADLAATYCRRLEACAPLALLRLFGDQPWCVTRTRITCQIAAAAPGTKVTAGPLGQCGRGLASAGCADIAVTSPIAACFPPGSRIDGRPCAVGSQCASGYCRIGAAPCGQCSPRLAAGARCDRAESGQCQRGLTCAEAGSCVLPGGVGAACNPQSRPCQPHLACAGGLCLLPAAASAPCTGEECGPLSGFWCDKPLGALRGSCRPVVRAAAGERCGATGTVVAVCIAGGRCEAGPDGSLRCVDAADDDQGCGEAFDRRGCVWPAVCAGQLCRLPVPATCG
jgi:hypothetical protein